MSMTLQPRANVGKGRREVEATRYRIPVAAPIVSDDLQRLALDAIGLGIWYWNLVSGELDWTPKARAIAGIDDSVAMDSKFFYSLIHPDDIAALIEHDAVVARGGIAGVYEIFYRLIQPMSRKTIWIEERGQVFYDADGKPAHMVGAVKDVTREKTIEQALIYAAKHDALTGLLNYRSIQVALARVVKKARRVGSRPSILIIDLDQFQAINDAFGYEGGDLIIKLMAARIADVVGDGASISRLGGDEFAVVLDGEVGTRSARSIGYAICAAIREPFKHRGKLIAKTCSIGIAVFPDHAQAPRRLFKNADLALDAAKHRGRNQVVLYDDEMGHSLERRIAQLDAMRAALKAGQIIPFYQPKVDLKTGRIIGFEALARWMHPDRGILSPAAFEAALADPYLAAQIDEAIRQRAIVDIARWRRNGLPCGCISLNFSSMSLAAPHVVDEFLSDLEAENVPPANVEIEITEQVFLDCQSIELPLLLQKFRAAGLKVSLDDFGTGFASLTHLKQMPVDELKIDQSFIRNLRLDPRDDAIVSAVIAMGHGVCMTTIAEGIETPEQAATLLQWGCNAGQGYLFGRPMPAADVPKLLLDNAARPFSIALPSAAA